MNERLILAYLAGAMDADGFFSMIKRTVRGSTTYSEFIGLAQLSQTVPKMLQERFGGYIQHRIRKGEQAKNWRPIYYWAAGNKNATKAIEALRPFLQVKTEQADILIELRKSKRLPASKRRTVKVNTRWRALTPDVQAHRESLYNRIKALNHNGVVT